MTTIDRNVDGKITDELVAKVRARLGEVTKIDGAYNSEATLDTIRHFVEGIGDDNPLWLNPEYAAKSRYGALVAPPSFLLTCNQGPIWRGRASGGFRGFTGVHRYWAADAWEYHQVIKRGDTIWGESHVAELIEHKNSSMGGRVFEDITIQRFYNQRNEVVADHRMSFFNVERATARDRGKHKQFEEYVWTPETLAKLHADIRKEARRGATPRYFEDVKVGEEIPWVVKGPLSQCEIVAFHAGWGGLFLLASEIAQKFIQEHPKANVPDLHNNAPDFPMRAHWDREFARSVGAPSAYDFGGQRVAWMEHGLTNWCGDEGVVKSIDARFVKFNVLGDATWCRAKITGKQVVNGEPLVHFDCSGENQRHEVTVTAKASVRLPSRPGA